MNLLEGLRIDLRSLHERWHSRVGIGAGRGQRVEHDQPCIEPLGKIDGGLQSAFRQLTAINRNQEVGDYVSEA